MIIQVTLRKITLGDDSISLLRRETLHTIIFHLYIYLETNVDSITYHRRGYLDRDSYINGFNSAEYE